MLSISKRHAEDLAREGVLPKPIHLGRSLRFEVAALRRFVEQEATKAAETNGEGSKTAGSLTRSGDRLRN
jgi:hypothetical protein